VTLKHDQAKQKGARKTAGPSGRAQGQSPCTPPAADRARSESWLAAFLYVLPALALILGLFTYWFAIANRSVVFLYDHDMGPLVPDTSPFGRVTRSRTWMAGLVASGAVMLLYVAANWLLGRLAARYRPPAWWRVWATGAAVLLAGVPAIVMTVNEPTLPAGNAAQVTLVTLVGLGLALTPGWLAAERPRRLVWLAADGVAVALLLLTVYQVEKVSRWLARGGTVWVAAAAVGAALGLLGLAAMTGLRHWRRVSTPGTGVLLAAGATIAYLFTPLLHHLVGTDGYFYISDSDNFFAQSGWGVQIADWLIAAGVVAGTVRLRRWLGRRR